MVLVKPFLGEAPESFEAVDVDAASCEELGVVEVEMPVSAEHEAVVGLEPVRVHDATSADGLDREAQQGLAGDVGYLGNPDAPSALQNDEDSNLSGRSTATLPLASCAEVRLVEFHFPTQAFLSILRFTEDGHAQGRDGLVGGLVADSELGWPSCESRLRARRA